MEKLSELDNMEGVSQKEMGCTMVKALKERIRCLEQQSHKLVAEVIQLRGTIFRWEARFDKAERNLKRSKDGLEPLDSGLWWEETDETLEKDRAYSYSFFNATSANTESTAGAVSVNSKPT